MKKPVLRYHGGKWRIAPWIIRHFPQHEFYIEPFSGAGSVLMRKLPSKVEVINDINSRVVNCFQVLRDHSQAEKVMDLLRLTPCAEEEYRICREISEDPIEDARRLLVLGRQSHGSTGTGGGKHTGWRRGSLRRNSDYVRKNDWGVFWEEVLVWADRLRNVYIENKNAATVIDQWDNDTALFYVDPPYLHSLRNTKHVYKHEMTDDDHRKLAKQLKRVKGAVVLSGYPSVLYDQELYPDWRRVECVARADKGKASIEVLWMNEKAISKRLSKVV